MKSMKRHEIDGANEWHKLALITLPIIRPVATIILFLALVNGLNLLTWCTR